MRSTRDVDIVASIQPAQAGLLAATLGRDWYADADQMRDAIIRGRSFNLIFMPTVEKFDIFPAATDFQISQLERATVENIPFAGEVLKCRVATAEDILLAKLQGYRIRGEVSDQQWRDIGGIIAVNPDLDLAYLETWATRLQVSDLLARAMTEARQ
jgi:hypothetical protein